eukprot:CAMPEP_0176480944 /NCGR_PEP_ID=MMETSP0200_2-20121128/2551_1 /TAXON_ID=947934 /ORGANISM="Chaetoceros sp., Strain GSL56" /LENGTH=575 /DNA_ID=CAMNT_0017877105 /DNA_START=224 /DNA_END=1951 /DNA_ORIENTATION=-
MSLDSSNGHYQIYRGNRTTTANEVPTGVHPALKETRFSKVVEFDIPDPCASSKRPRASAEITAQNVTLAIQYGVLEKDRKEAIYNACAAFDHGVQAAHDDEIRVGADTAIFKHLTFLLYKRNVIDGDAFVENLHESDDSGSDQQQNSSKVSEETDQNRDAMTEEITSTLEGLEMVLRCSADCVSISYYRIGQEALPIILSLLQQQLSQKLKSHRNAGRETCHMIGNMNSFQSISTASASVSEKENSSLTNSVSRHCGDSILKTGTKIIGHFARVGQLTEELASTKHLLATLKNIISAPKELFVPIESRMNCLWIIANLACSADNMIKMANHPGLVDTIVNVASHPDSKDEEDCQNVMEYLQIIRSRSIAVRAIHNLSWAEENKIPLAENMELVEALLDTVSHRRSDWTGHGKGVSTILLQSRKHAAAALRNIAAAPRRYKRRLCRLRDGSFLETLAEFAMADPDRDVRDKIHATLYNLVSADTAKQFIEKKAVLDVIVNAATSSMGEDSENDSNDNTTQSMAVKTLRSLEKAIPENENDYDALRPVLSRFDSQIAMNKSQINLGMGMSSHDGRNL